MPAAENPKVGGCYVWVISLLLFVCTISGAIFLVLYMTENESTPSTFWYPIVGVSLVCLPWFFWLLTFLYRIISRSFGFRFICFNPFGSGYPDDEIAPSATGGSGGLGLGTSVFANTGRGDGGEGKIENGNESGESRDPTQPGSPRRVHFGGVVILGEEIEDENGKRDSPRPSSSSSSSSSSAPTSMQSNESEIPLRLAMAS